VNAFDYVFWFGDFNYRVEMEREKVVECLDNSDCMVGQQLYRYGEELELSRSILSPAALAAARSAHQGDSTG